MFVEHALVAPAIGAKQPEVGELAEVRHFKQGPYGQAAEVIHIVGYGIS